MCKSDLTGLHGQCASDICGLIHNRKEMTPDSRGAWGSMELLVDRQSWKILDISIRFAKCVLRKKRLDSEDTHTHKKKVELARETQTRKKNKIIKDHRQRTSPLYPHPYKSRFESSCNHLHHEHAECEHCSRKWKPHHVHSSCRHESWRPDVME